MMMESVGGAEKIRRRICRGRLQRCRVENRVGEQDERVAGTGVRGDVSVVDCSVIRLSYITIDRGCSGHRQVGDGETSPVESQPAPFPRHEWRGAPSHTP